MTTKTKTILFAGLIMTMMVPLTGINMAAAVNENAEAHVANIQAELPAHVIPVQERIDNAIDRNPNWIGLITWDEQGASIKYLGPGNENPYRLNQEQWQHRPPVDMGIDDGVLPTADAALTTPINVFDSIYWRELWGNNDIYKIEQTFPLKASTTTGVDLYHWLDAKSSTTNQWLQASAVYDKAKLFDTTEKWYANFDLWHTSDCTEDSSFPIQSPVSFTTDNTATSYIRGDSTAGKYKMFVSSGAVGAGVTFTISGDNGHNIDVGYTSGSGCAFPSGAHVEEQSNNGNKHYYGTIEYTYGFYETSSSSKETSVYSYNGKGGYGGSVTEYTNPAKLKFSCTGTLTCP